MILMLDTGLFHRIRWSNLPPHPAERLEAR
jgi:hypothetical protein